jgi:hypothetical protein
MSFLSTPPSESAVTASFTSSIVDIPVERMMRPPLDAILRR